jgi:hypothetical protein
VTSTSVGSSTGGLLTGVLRCGLVREYRSPPPDEHPSKKYPRQPLPAVDRRSPQGRILRRMDLPPITKRYPSRWDSYTPYKVANLVLEFSTSIPRTQLRPGYGDGFLGAPLHVGPPGKIPHPRHKETVVARRANTSRQTLEVSRTFEPGHISPACVAQAYEWVMPIRRRPALSKTLAPAQAEQPTPQQLVRRRDSA